MGEKWLETHVRSHIAFECARVLRAEIRFVVRAHSRTQIPKSARAFASANSPRVRAHMVCILFYFLEFQILNDYNNNMLFN